MVTPFSPVPLLIVSQNSDEMIDWEPAPKYRAAVNDVPFTTFVQARICFESTFNEMMAFVHELDIYTPSAGEELQAAINKYGRIRSQFEKQSLCLDMLISRLRGPLSKVDKKAILSIRLIRDQVGIFLKVFNQFGGETGLLKIGWAIDDEDMETILDLACQLLGAPTDLLLPDGSVPEDYYTAPADKDLASGIKTIPFTPPAFTPCTGLVPAVWLGMSRSTNTSLRRRAIALLLHYPRREGPWDSVLAGRVAWEKMRFEEEALKRSRRQNQIPRVGQKGLVELDWNYVRDIIIKFPTPRAAQVEFRNVQQHEAGERGWIKQIVW